VLVAARSDLPELIAVANSRGPILCFICHYWPTARNAVLLQKLAVPLVVKKFPTFYGTRRFITVFITANHLFLSWARSIQSMSPSHSWRSILLLSFHLLVGLPSRLFLSGLSTKIPYARPHTCHMPNPAHHSLFCHPSYVSWAVLTLNPLIMLLPKAPCYLFLHRPRYLPQHPILEHPQPVFLP